MDNQAYPTVDGVEYARAILLGRAFSLDSLPMRNPTAFYEEGSRDYGQPAGPVISYFLPNIDRRAIIEEAFHFVEWDENRRNEKTSRTQEQMLLGSIASEAGAQFIIDATTKTRKPLKRFHIGSRDRKKVVDLRRARLSTYVQLRDSLYANTSKGFVAKLLELNGCTTFDELREKNHFSSLVGSFPSELTHFVGYHLGRRISERLLDDAIPREQSLDVFRGAFFPVCHTYPKQPFSEEEQLDGLVALAK